MKKFMTYVIALASVSTLAACASNGMSEQDETLTQAPYSQERTVGSSDAAPVRSADRVFKRRQAK